MTDLEQLIIAGESFERMISAQEIQEKVAALAQQIKADVEDGDKPLFIGVLKGAFIFLSDLVREYPGECELDFIRIQSYVGTESGGKIKTFPGMDFNRVRSRHVVIVEDIVDTGLSMDYLKKTLEPYKPKTLKIASLFLKPSRLKVDVKVDYSCFTIPDAFIVGYGLDLDERYRNLPAVYVKK